MLAEAVLWSFGADGRVPRLAQWRVILFFCPTRASSQNQISTGLRFLGKGIAASCDKIAVEVSRGELREEDLTGC